MTTRQRLELRQSEIRQRLNELAAIDEPSDDERSELERLGTEYRDLEPRLRAAIIAEQNDPDVSDDPGPAGAEFRNLADRARGEFGLARIIAALAGAGGALDGATAELMQARGVSDRQAPIDLFASEHRAAATVVAPGNVGVETRPIVQPVFPMPAAAFMGIAPMIVGSGEQATNIITAPTSGPAAAAKAGAVAASAVTFSSAKDSPSRFQASGTVNREDLAALETLDAGIRTVLTDAVGAGIEAHVIAATGIGLTDHGTDPTADSDTITWATAKSKLYGQVDGRYAGMASDVRLLIGSDTNAILAGLYRGTGTAAADQTNALEELQRVSGGVMVSANVPAAASNIAQAVFYRMGGSEGAARLFQWARVELIVDPYTLSDDGQIKITAIALASFRVTRAANYPRTTFKLA